MSSVYFRAQALVCHGRLLRSFDHQLRLNMGKWPSQVDSRLPTLPSRPQTRLLMDMEEVPRRQVTPSQQAVLVALS